MVSDQRKKFHRRHLKRNRDILIGIHHDHIIFFINSLQISPAVISRHLHFLRQIKIGSRQIGDLLVYLHAFHRYPVKIFHALMSIGPCSHPQDQHLRLIFFQRIRHQGRRQRIIIIHAGKPVLFHFNGLHPE